VVLNVPDDVNKKTNDRDIRADIGLSPEVHLAVYVGKITFGRGLEQVIMALPHCPEVHFAMLGPKVVSTVDIITRLAEKYNVLNRVHVLDPVAPHEVISYLSTADTGVVPIQDVCLSYRFCMPNKLFELAIAGIPVAVSNLPDMRAFVEREGVGVVMDQTDPEDIARAIRETYQRREELILTSERLSDFRKKYSWQGQAEKLVQLYDGLAGNGQLQTGTARPAA
jgi:glycosyltransferase involved in cell wall biosynthesis